MARVVNTHEAKTHLSRLLDAALAGEEIIIARRGKPLVRLVPVEPPAKRSLLGALEGKIVLHEGWDEDIPEDWFEVLTGEDS